MGKKGTLKPINENLINYTKERFSIPGDNYLIRSFRHFYEHGYNFVLSSKHVNPIFIKKGGKCVCCIGLHWRTYYIVKQYRKSALIAAKFLCSRNAIEYNKYQLGYKCFNLYQINHYQHIKKKNSWSRDTRGQFFDLP